MPPLVVGPPPAPVRYPDSDGQPMAENTLQFRWIVTVQGNLELLYADRPDVFVAGDNLIYPDEGDNKVRQAPDVYVAFGRPKGDRGSYKVWEEAGVFPQVVFEVLSPGNRSGEMARKFIFYERHGVEEYYILDPDHIKMEGYVRRNGGLDDVPEMHDWVSPRLGIRFRLGTDLELYYPDGRPFLSFVEIGRLQDRTSRQLVVEKQRAEAEKHRADAEKQRAEAEKQRADEAAARAERLAARLRELGVDPAG
ncbi:MAG: Uma2 family endonuclease [Gemmataceae bacterium]|nr:Uma2 family endonuclease [Gemmataceae bacterium]